MVAEGEGQGESLWELKGRDMIQHKLYVTLYNVFEHFYVPLTIGVTLYFF